LVRFFFLFRRHDAMRRRRAQSSRARGGAAATANAIAAHGKGILAADESVGTIGKRFAPINVENNQVRIGLASARTR